MIVEQSQPRACRHAASPKTVEEPPYTWRTNYRDKYKDKEIDNGVTAMVIKHLRLSGLFKDVIEQNSQRHADMELSGTIAEYTTQGRINKGAEIRNLSPPSSVCDSENIVFPAQPTAVLRC